MNARVMRPIATLFLLILALAAPSAGAAETLPWRADRPLTWSDFRGEVPQGAAPHRAAMTTTSLGWRFAYQLEWSRGTCRYRITEISASAVFHPDESWVRPEHRNDAILAHEQGHFDITQIHRLMLEHALAPYVGTTGACEGRDEERISADVQRRLADTLGEVYQRIARNHDRVQADYDRETQHSIDAASQARWQQIIAAALRGEGWDNLTWPPAISRR